MINVTIIFPSTSDVPPKDMIVTEVPPVGSVLKLPNFWDGELEYWTVTTVAGRNIFVTQQ